MRSAIVSTPIYSEKTSLYKFYIFKFNDGTGAFILNIHHLISDGWTLGFICNEIIKTYSKLKNNFEIETKAIYSYIDYISDEKKYLQSDIKNHIEYNLRFRPGRALFVDGKCINKGYLSDEKVAEWEERIKTLDIDDSMKSLSLAETELIEYNSMLF